MSAAPDYVRRLLARQQTRDASCAERLARPAARTSQPDAIECPHCGFKATDDLYDYDTDDEWTCGWCEGTATLYCETTRWFTAIPKDAPESAPEAD